MFHMTEFKHNKTHGLNFEEAFAILNDITEPELIIKILE